MLTIPYPLALLFALTCGLPLLGCAYQLGRRAERRDREDRGAILQAVAALQPDGRGFTIEQEASRRLGRRLGLGSLYAHLFRLEENGMIASRWGDATAERGWKRPKHYWITADAPLPAPLERGEG